MREDQEPRRVGVSRLRGARCQGRLVANLIAPMLLALGCSPTVDYSPPRLLSGKTSWSAPLYEPLTAHAPQLWASARQGSKQLDALLVVDSGSTVSALSEETLAALGAQVSTWRGASAIDAAGMRARLRGVTLEELQLGELNVREMQLASSGAVGLLGVDILGQRDWELDLDRGLLTLGAAPWPSGAAVVTLPARPLRGHRVVELSVAGQAVPLLLDTGGHFTAVNETTLRSLGLSPLPLERELTFVSVHGKFHVAQRYRAALALGEIELGTRDLLPRSHRCDAWRCGMLGWDVLNGFSLQVGPDSVRLKPRAAVLSTVAERVRRWPAAPVCDDTPACVLVQLEPGTNAARLQVLADYPEPYAFLFGCLDESGQLRDDVPWLDVGILRARAGHAIDAMHGIPEPLRRTWGAQCRNWALLDINPARSSGWARRGQEQSARWSAPAGRLVLR